MDTLRAKLRYLSTAHDALQTDISVTKRASEKADVDMTQAQVDKEKQVSAHTHTHTHHTHKHASVLTSLSCTCVGHLTVQSLDIRMYIHTYMCWLVEPHTTESLNL